MDNKTCQDCGKETYTKKHSDKSMRKVLKGKRGYYTQWEYCLPCRKVWTDLAYYKAIP